MADIEAINHWLRAVKKELKLTAKRSTRARMPDDSSEDSEEVYYPVDAFLDERFEQGRRFLLVQWAGYHEPSWEPIDNVNECDNLLKLFSKDADQGFDECDNSFEEEED
ncbi:hypothetical protein AAVH_17865 [Aphelenchoides avenae]|nr:hypothetical protein AAVH_17865 [Aphelenchus avenae]